LLFFAELAALVQEVFTEAFFLAEITLSAVLFSSTAALSAVVH